MSVRDVNFGGWLTRLVKTWLLLLVFGVISLWLYTGWIYVAPFFHGWLRVAIRIVAVMAAISLFVGFVQLIVEWD